MLLMLNENLKFNFQNKLPKYDESVRHTDAAFGNMFHKSKHLHAYFICIFLSKRAYQLRIKMAFGAHCIEQAINNNSILFEVECNRTFVKSPKPSFSFPKLTKGNHHFSYFQGVLTFYLF